MKDQPETHMIMTDYFLDESTGDYLPVEREISVYSCFWQWKKLTAVKAIKEIINN